MRIFGALFVAAAVGAVLPAPAEAKPAAKGAKSKTGSKSKEAQAAAPQAQDPCAQVAHAALPEGPVVLGFFYADTGTGRRACPRTEVGLIAGGDAEIDIPEFRALLGGGTTVFGSYAVNGQLEVFGTFEAVRLLYAQNASPSASLLGLGQLTGGATYVVWSAASTVVGVTGRLMLPTTTLTLNYRPMALEAGTTVSHRFGSQLEVHAFAGGSLAFGISPGPAHVQPGLLFGGGVQWAPASWFAVVAGVSAHLLDRTDFAAGGDQPLLDYLAPSLGLRFRAGQSFGIELGLATHVAGARSFSTSPALRTESALALRTSYRF